MSRTMADVQRVAGTIEQLYVVRGDVYEPVNMLELVRHVWFESGIVTPVPASYAAAPGEENER